jgi:hypothetical protein
VIQLIELVGRLGRKGGLLFLALGFGFAGIHFALSSDGLPVSERLEVVFYSPAVWGFSGLCFVVGLYLVITDGGAWKRDDRFQPMSAVELTGIVKVRPTPFCVCLDCMVFLPYEVSVGRCPRCRQSSSCLEVLDEADRATAVNAIPTGR